MTILLTGANGQVGWEVKRRTAASGVLALDRSGLDVTDRAAVEHLIRRVRPAVVINAAAYTAVDRAEGEVDRAFSVNRDGAGFLARACQDHGAALIHFSTDYVFDGRKTGPWLETDPVSPLGVYGRSKWEGEEAVRRACARHIVLRVSWVFGSHGHNFVRTMLRLGAERDSLGIVSDQRGCPTWAGHIADTALALAARIDAAESLPWGTYHYTGAPVTSWFGFAQSVFSEARDAGLLDRVPRLSPITTADYPTPARRPANSELDCGLIDRQLNISPQPWRDGLRQVMFDWKQDRTP